mmetsp:Transcript_92691/g.271348  ORF Transcript_92691/g.271348 Transcript_92691/m.271348 type:complete len:215 (+) Transcript_92691:209-853(+)
MHWSVRPSKGISGPRSKTSLLRCIKQYVPVGTTSADVAVELDIKTAAHRRMNFQWGIPLATEADSMATSALGSRLRGRLHLSLHGDEDLRAPAAVAHVRVGSLHFRDGSQAVCFRSRGCGHGRVDRLAQARDLELIHGRLRLNRLLALGSLLRLHALEEGAGRADVEADALLGADLHFHGVGHGCWLCGETGTAHWEVPEARSCADLELEAEIA